MQAQSLTKYAMYIKEKFNDELIEHEHGFITYKLMGRHVFIKNIWIHPDHRLKGIGKELADKVVKIGKDQGCNLLLSTVLKTINNWGESLEANLHYGLKESNQTEEKIYLMKEI